MITTLLHETDLNQPLPNVEVQQVLDQVRAATMKDWQVVPITTRSRKWWNKKQTGFYGVYVYVGGLWPWQQINFFSSDSDTSINPDVTLDVVAAYLTGILVGVDSCQTADHRL